MQTVIYYAYILQDIQASESRVTEVNILAEKLLKERHPDSELIHSRQESLNQSWRDLTTIAKYREQRLAGAHEIQRFNRQEKTNTSIIMLVSRREPFFD